MNADAARVGGCSPDLAPGVDSAANVVLLTSLEARLSRRVPSRLIAAPGHRASNIRSGASRAYSRGTIGEDSP